MWRALVDEAMRTGHLLASPHAGALTANLAGIYLINILEWVYGETGIELMEARTHYGFALALAGHAEPAQVPRLQQRVHESLDRIAALETGTAIRTEPATRVQVST